MFWELDLLRLQMGRETSILLSPLKREKPQQLYQDRAHNFQIPDLSR